MTEQERIRDDDGQHTETAYTAPAETKLLPESAPRAVTPGYGTDTLIMPPIDRVRWSAVVAGLFAALSTLTLVSLLGLAIGFSIYNPGNPARNFGVSAGFWGAISALIAFGVGGWVAARTAAVAGRANGALNGAMVWVVTIPLLLYLLGGGISGLVTIASGTVATGAQVAAPLVGQPANAPALQPTAQELANQGTPEAGTSIITTASTAALGTLISLLLGLGAAVLGGLMGARSFTGLVATMPLVQTTKR
jgi:hypothetical protein